MKKTACIILSLALVFAVSFTAVWAQEKKVENQQVTAAAPDDKEKAEFTKKVDLFYQVVSLGEAQKDPLVLITAVKLLDSLPFKGVVKDSVKEGQDPKDAPRYDRVALLNQAKELAAGDKELLAVIAKVQEPPEKTEVRRHGRHHGGHGGHRGHGGWHGGHHGYYVRHHHPRFYGCTWLYLCGYGGCDWVCR
ncbi:MAG: hypothetical protein AB9866_17910 [Syntrophobacteraceae bacterium]